MAEKHDEFKVHLLSFTDEELDTIIRALRDVEADYLANDIESAIADFDYDDDCDCCGVVNDGLDGVVGNNVATLTLDVDTKGMQDKIDKLLKSANEACDALYRLRGDC